MTGFAMFVAVVTVAFLTMAATSVRAVSRLWLRHWIEHRAGGVGAMTRYLERPMRLVHAAGTASMLVVFATGALIAMADGLRAWAFVFDVTMLLVLLLVFGQLLPRAIARDSDDELRDGLEELLRDGTFRDIGATEEMAIISGVVQFGDKSVRDVMTPHADIFSLREGLPPAELARQVATAGYSRIPVYRDLPEQIVGMVHVFDVFRRPAESWPAIRPVSVTSADKRAKELLFELLRSRRQLAIVRDADAIVGLVTLEDLLEELVGDIRDEHDDSTD